MTKIMLIEDDYDNRVLLAECLRMENYEVITANNGVAALELLKEISPPELILMDLGFPKGSASEFVSELRTRTGGYRIPIIVLSGRTDIKKQSTEIEASYYFQKPYDLNQLFDTIAEAVQMNVRPLEKVS
jgi:DNA-binding response OmpR family regulator